MLQVDPTTGMDLYKIVQNFGIVGFLILGIKYFINESKRSQSEFSQKEKEQEERHKEEREKQNEFHQRENELKELKLEKLRDEVLELRVSLSKYEESH
jgi:Sec-independent protein translocase protein TatA